MHADLTNRAILSFVFVTVVAVAVVAQSSSQEFPTAVISNEVSGTIKARDLGDSRLTTFYFTFNGEQGDLFINLVTRNFAGDIDVFTANGLRPLTKIVVYADYGETETGRAVYLRKPEKLLLRVQGRTPNDDEAAFRLKFAGSFVAARAEDVPAAPELPKVNSESRAGIRVNAVGTILPAPPKTDPPAVAEKESTESEVPMKSTPADTVEKAPEVSIAARPEVVVSDNLPAEQPEAAKSEVSRSSRRRSARRSANPPAAVAVKGEDEKPAGGETRAEAGEPKTPGRTESPSFRTLTDDRRTRRPKKEEPEVDPMASINLVVQFKNGESLEKRMSEVFKFTVDKGVLTVVLKNGSVTRYPIVDVAKVTIE